MRRLHLVPGTSHDPPPSASADPATTTLHVVPSPALDREQDSPAEDSASEQDFLSDFDREMRPSPEALAAFAEAGALLHGLTPEEQLEAARTLYHDSDGRLRARSQNLRLT